MDELKPILSPVSSSDDDSDQESFTEYIKRSQDILTSSLEVPTSFDVTNAMASCGTSDSALSEMDCSSITIPDVMSSEDVFAEVQQLLSSMTDGTLKCEDLSYSPSLRKIQSKLTARKRELQSHRTSRLWLQYLDMIHLLKMHRNAERTGQWEEQLHILKSMQPYLAAAGHYQYAKAISLFLVEIMQMKKKEPENWTKLAKTHVIRRSYNHWSGIATDLIIEQVLKCSLKSIGGLSHGRGWSEAQQLSWFMSRPTCAEYNHSLEKLTSVSFLSSDQHSPTHSWSTGARMTRDKQDVDKLTTLFTTYDPFSLDPTLHFISTGVVASTSANVDDAQSIGGEDIGWYGGSRSQSIHIPSVIQSKNTSSSSRDWGEWREGICQPTTAVSTCKCSYIYEDRWSKTRSLFLRTVLAPSCPLWPQTFPTQWNQERACWCHMEAGRSGAYWKASSCLPTARDQYQHWWGPCNNRGKSLMGVRYYTAFHGVSVTWLGSN